MNKWMMTVCFLSLLAGFSEPSKADDGALIVRDGKVVGRTSGNDPNLDRARRLRHSGESYFYNGDEDAFVYLHNGHAYTYGRHGFDYNSQPAPRTPSAVPSDVDEVCGMERSRKRDRCVRDYIEERQKLIERYRDD